MSTYEPGTVAVATVRGVEGVRVMPRVTRGGETDGWLSSERVELNVIHHDDQVTDVRPLVVLDPHAANEYAPRGLVIRNLVETLRADEEHLSSKAFADQIEAQTKPPRIPEPGLWGVVDAGAGRIPVRRWVHHEEDWWVADTGDRVMWGDLEDPILVREGVQS